MLSSLLQVFLRDRTDRSEQLRRRRVHNRRLRMEGLENRLLLATIEVDDDLADCKKADFTTIQAAVNAAAPGDKIRVCEGTYTEQVTIPATKDDLDIRSKKKHDAVIQAPAVMTQVGIVQVDGAEDVTIRGFKIQGPFADFGAGLRTGVFVQGGGSATIQENHITAIRGAAFDGAQNGLGILIGRGSTSQVGTATIKKNLIDDYQKNGIQVDFTGSSATIRDNDIVGQGPTTLNAQNGIQVGRGATAVVKENEISGNDFTPVTAAATGILIADTSGVTIDDNKIHHNEVGILTDFFGPPFSTIAATTDITIEDNHVFKNSGTGILLRNTSLSLVKDNKSEKNGNNGISLINSNNNTVKDNKSRDNLNNGYVLDNSDGNTIDDNDGRRNGGHGIIVTNGSSGNSITDNHFHDNGLFDAFDDTIGGGTAGTANFWDDNHGDTEDPAGLLD